ncbi:MULTISPECIES: CHAT domain-containing protein [Calothrix]|uniref:CHAT domain-containing protein n=2 Tax=Calothrix TaxID=1186 RepID=A0ABR8A961_9CYAN|nr:MULTISPECIES: CHAT domain-containing protein [Calothrix]MBD2196015.1 CHAT domain-containing protein [Calothrix parietina FACHB-288]MBD2224495.1 CHAT domain-containing protein [Calothrix anomala FACHB-343]
MQINLYYFFKKSSWKRLYIRLIVFIFWIFLGLVGSLLPAIAKMDASPPSLMQVSSNVAQQEEQGRQYYDAGQFLAAIKIWEQVLQIYQSQGDRLNQARVLSNLSLSYQQLGLWTEATQAITRSRELLQGKHTEPEYLKVLAQVFNTQGSLELATGKSEAALLTWQQATATYTQVKNETGVLRSLINQSQALKALGLYRRALSTLNQVNKILQKQPDSPIKTAGLRSLGASWRLVGNLTAAQQVLQQSLAIAQKLQSPAEMSATLIDLGNVARANQDATSALALYQQAVNIAPSSMLKMRSQLNQLSTLIDTKQWTPAQALWSQIQPQLVNLPPSRTAIYAQLNLAQSLIRLKQANLPNAPTTENIAQLVANNLQQAKTLGDKQAQAYALGKLGGLYEQTQQWAIAQDLTQQALVLAQSINTPEIAYRWQWQLGRLLKVQGDEPGAIAAYTQAVNTLQSLRSDLVAIDPDIQFSFRETVEPVYRELVSLLLSGTSSPSQEALKQARQVIESLQLAELDDFFREACLDRKYTQIDELDPLAAVIYPIILPDRLEVIVSLPKQPLRHYATSLPQAELESIVEKLRKTLVIRSKEDFLPLSQQVYDWLIRPVETDLVKSGIKTLVFVPDGVLRNIPMAALHDSNQQYLVEKYNIALTPSLQLLPPKTLAQHNFKVLGAGLTEARQGFSALEYVEQEMKEIKSEVPSTVLLNQEFTSKNLQNYLQSAIFPIVHIATHGKFSSKAIETFILAWDDRIRINDLDNLLQISEQKQQQAIELLVLSACETAVGDKRAALGLAGIAVKAGASSTLATLWSVNDEATANLMRQFYKHLSSTKETKAEALRHAQMALLKDPQSEHPVYWAPYILVGNWL